MAQATATTSKINTKPTQPSRRRVQRRVRLSGDARESVRSDGRTVIEMEHGITVYPPDDPGAPWRAVFTENGRRRYRQAVTEAELAGKLEKVIERLTADAANMERPGADLI